MIRTVSLLAASAGVVFVSSPLLRSSQAQRTTPAPADRPAREVAEAASSTARSVDLDADGLADLAVLHADGRLALFRRSGDGSLSPGNELLGPQPLPLLRRALWRDVDRDGDADLLALGRGGSSWFLRNDGGHLVRVNDEVGLPAAGIVDALWVDADADGDDDLLSFSEEGTRLHENRGGLFVAQVLETVPVVFAQPGAPAPGGAPRSASREAGALAEGGPEASAKPERAPEGRGSSRSIPSEGRHPVGSLAAASEATAPFGSEEFNESPMGLCTPSITDQSGGACIQADSAPAMGRLFPLGIDLFVEDPSRRVGMGTLTPGARLEVAPQMHETGVLVNAQGDASAGVFNATSTSTPALLARSGGLAGFFEGALHVGRQVNAVLTTHTTIDDDPLGNSLVTLLDSAGRPMIELLANEHFGNGALLSMSTFGGNETLRFDAHSSAGNSRIEMFRSGAGEMLELSTSGTSTSGSTLEMFSTASNSTLRLESEDTPSTGSLLTMGLGNGTPTVLLDAEDLSNSASLRLFDRGGQQTFEVLAQESGQQGAYLEMREAGGTPTVRVDAHFGTGAELALRSSSNSLFNNDTIRMLSEPQVGDGAHVELSTFGGVETIILDAQAPQGAELSLRAFNAQETVEIVSQQDASHGSLFTMRDLSGTRTIEFDSQEGSNGGGEINVYNAAGVRTAYIDADQGGSSRIRVDVLEIDGGDLVEDFKTGGVAMEPGTVMSIVTDRPGELRPSSRPYDSRVAGIVSGAGDVRAGVRMGQSEVLKGDSPVALTGRVYVRCNTENGAIQPGDLLTSSSTVGVAMRATDPERAFGSVIGKALTGHAAASGEEGLVLVLVSLQ